MEELLDLYGVEEACEHCPHRHECAEKELYWGCVVWEEEMGEDL